MSLTARERYIAALQHRETDRMVLGPPGPWAETLERWHGEGLPEKVDLGDYFGTDALAGIGAFHSDMPKAFPHRIIQDDGEMVIDWTHLGVKVMWFKKPCAPSTELEFSVRELPDWERMRWALDVNDDRLIPQAVAQSREARRRDAFITVNPMDPYWFCYKLLGVENLLIQMAECPEFIETVCADYTEFLLQMLERTVKAGVAFDAVFFFSDMGYKNGPLFSPAMYERFFLGHHRRIKEFCVRYGKYMFLHTDGRIERLIPGFIRAGFDLLNNLEAKAGCDVREFKPLYGDSLCFWGNIAVDVIAGGDRDAIEEEIRAKVTVAKRGGGYIFDLDSLPPGVSLQSYQWALECARKYGRT